jgi:cytochrome c551/c552
LNKEDTTKTKVMSSSIEEASLLPDSSSMDSASLAYYTQLKEGEEIFKEAGCYSCHDICRKKVGPALKGVTQRRERKWIYQAITNFSVLKGSGDKIANQLFNEFKVEMPTHTFLKKEEIDKIIFYIDSSACNDIKRIAPAEACIPNTGVSETILVLKKNANLKLLAMNIE